MCRRPALAKVPGHDGGGRQFRGGFLLGLSASAICKVREMWKWSTPREETHVESEVMEQ